MACWSAENATKAYLSTLKMGQNAKEPDVAEFISALAAGNNAQTMVVACAGAAGPATLLALVAAAHQTGGRVTCIVSGHEELTASKIALGPIASNQVQFMVGDPQDFVGAADFVLIDCNLENHEQILKAVQAKKKRSGGGGTVVVVGYNAFGCRGSWCSCGTRTQLLPIGEGLLVTRINGESDSSSPKHAGGRSMGKINKSRWVVKVDKCTGEEHVFRVRIPQGKVIHA